MVKLFVRNERLYREKAGKSVQLTSATIDHFQPEGVYKLRLFLGKGKTETYTQKSYPIPSIKLTKYDVGMHIHSGVKAYLGILDKHYYINYYVY